MIRTKMTITRRESTAITIQINIEVLGAGGAGCAGDGSDLVLKLNTELHSLGAGSIAITLQK